MASRGVDCKAIVRAMRHVRKFAVSQDGDGAMRWTLQASAADCPHDLAKALHTARASRVVFALVFDADYPIKPPFVRLVQPEMRYLSGHVVTGGAICAEVLTMTDSPAAWRPTYTIEALFESLLAMMAEGRPRFVDTDEASSGLYTEENARFGLQRVAKRYKWSL